MTKTATWRDTQFAKPFYRGKQWQNVRDLDFDREVWAEHARDEIGDE